MGSQPKRPLILASASPRRAALLDQVYLKYKIQPAGIEETRILENGSAPGEIAVTLAEKKALTVAKMYDLAIIVGADTVVHLDGQILGKPETETEAAAMLRMLSGRSHQVVTGVALVEIPEQTVHSFTEETTVHFRSLSREEINHYAASGEPMDKAGGYGIQGLGALLVDYIHGDYNNVVGFPLSRFYHIYREITQHEDHPF